MGRVVIAKSPHLDFILTSRRANEKNNCPLPLILNNDGSLDWDANAFLTHYAGGAQAYNIKPLAPTVVKKSYSLNIFCSFLDDRKTDLSEINDSTLYDFVETLKNRGINDQTIISHGRTALQYIIFLSDLSPDWNLAGTSPARNTNFKVHYTTLGFNKAGRHIKYFTHRSLDGLIHINTEANYIRDHELVKWFDAINCSTYHPDVNQFLVFRWEALGTLLEITGSRISEAHKITRSMIKDAIRPLDSLDKRPVLRGLPILKGKYKGKKRQTVVSNEDLQVIMVYISLVEKMFPHIDHDAIFVDAQKGAPLKSSYLKNYTRKVISGSPYRRDLRHLNNHSFRHRFITLTVAKAIKKISESGGFKNVLDIAATACRKITMHASNETLSRYIHLASEYNSHTDSYIEDCATTNKLRIHRMLTVAETLRSKKIEEEEALSSLLAILEEF